MSHEIYNDTAFAGLAAGWHGLGTVVPEAKTMSELLAAAGINWELAKTPLYFERETLTDSWMIQDQALWLMTRNGESLSAVVSKEFEFMQPAEIAAACDRIIAAGSFTPSTCMALGNGTRTVYCMGLGDWSIDGDQSRLRDYLTITDCPDGKNSMKAFVSTIRTVCNNTLNAGLRSAQVKLQLRHTSGHRVDFNTMVDSIIKSQNKVREAFVNLTKIRFDDARLKSYLEQVFDIPSKPDGVGDAQHAANVRRVLECREVSAECTMKMVRVEGAAFNGWSAWNGVSECLQHAGPTGKLMSTNIGLMLNTGTVAARLDRAYAMAERMK